nr:polyprotein [Scotophilus kuhlii parechovirus]
MEKLQNLAHSISDLLQDPVTEEKEQSSDRVAATTTVNTGNIVQSAVNPGAPMTPSFDNRDPYTAMAYDPMTAHNNLGKLVTIAEPASWANTQTRGTRLKFVELPKSLMYPIDMPGHAQAIYFRYVRSGYHICVQVNAAFGCAGSLMIVYHPDTDSLDTVESKTYFSSFTNLPHTILNLATATQADLFIPHISHKDYVKVNSTEGGRVGVYVWTVLKIPDGGPSSLDVTVLGSLIKPNYQCPKPPTSSERMINQGPPDKTFTEVKEGHAKQMNTKKYRHGKFKWSRDLVNIAEGPGSVNIANRLVTNGAQSLALVGERAVLDPRVAGSKARVKDIVDVLKIPTGCVLDSMQTFEWSLNKNSKELLSTGAIALTDWANFKQAANCYAFYRGSIVLHLTVFSSAFNRGRLRWCFYPLSTQTLTFNSSKNAINQICDIGLNSEFKMTIPFTSETWMRPITQSLGRFAIFVENKLTYTKACANTIDMVMMISAGDDFQLYVPTETMYNLQGMTSWGSEMDLVDPLNDSNDSIMEANNKSSFVNQTTVSAQGEGMASTVGLASTENKGSQDRIIQQNQPKFLNFEMCNVGTMAVSHTLVDNVFGRAARVNNVSYNNNNIGTMTLHFPANSHLSLARFFAYFSGEINLHIVNQSDGFLAISHTYDQNRTLTDFATSSGSVLIPPQTGMTVCVPFYSEFAFRVTTSEKSDTPRDLGRLIYKPEANSGLVIVYLSFRNPNFVFPMPVRKPATTRAMLEDPAQLASIHSWEHAEALAEQYEVDPDAVYQRPTVTEQNPIVQYIMKRTGWKRERLLLSGDVESNPGPNQPFPAAGGDTYNQAPSSAMAAPSEVVFRNRGLYKHYGIRHGDWVYHLTSENIADSALNGTATFTKTSSDGWQTAFPIHVDYFTANNLESLVGTSHIFSCDNNCETIIRDLFPGTPWITQSQALALAGGIILCATTLGYVSSHFTIHDLKEMFTLSCESSESAMHTMVQKCMSYFSNIFTQTFASDVVKVIVKAAVRLLCYVIMYCHSPNMLTTVCLGTLIIMDVTESGPLSDDTRGVLKSLVEGDIKGFAEAVVSKLQFSDSEEDTELRQNTVRAAKDLLELPSLSDEGPTDFLKGFNTVSQSGKHIEWWLQMFKRVFEFLKKLFAPSENQKIINWFEDNSELIANFLTTVNNHLTSIKRPEVAKDQAFQNQHIWLCRRLNELTTLAVKSATYSPLASTITKLCSEMHRVKLPQPTPVHTIRMEPVGVWICGEPGQGKSFFTQALVKQVNKKMGYVGVFTNPTGSEFMDGYSQQPVHIIDDAGQNRDELDLKLLCQCISSIPFTVPMADLNEKGMAYTSKLVVATSNKTDFTSTVLSDPSALKRRFPFYLRLRAKQQYVKDGKLDVPMSLAKMPFGDPWESTTDGFTWKPIDMAKLVDQICEELQKRESGVRRWKQILQDEGMDSDHDFISVSEMIDKMDDKLEDICDRFYAEICGNDSPFDCLRLKPEYVLQKSTAGIKDWVTKKIKAIKDWANRNIGWLTLISIFATGVSLIAAVSIFRRKKEQDQRPYNPQTTNPKGRQIFQNNPIQPYVMSNEAPYNKEIEHLYSNVCYINSEEYNGAIHCLALCGRKIITYGHVAETLGSTAKPYFVHKGLSHEIKNATMTRVSSDGKNMDLIIVEIHDLPYQFKDVRKYLSKQIGSESYLLWESPVGRIMYNVERPFLSGVNISAENTLNAESITYTVKSKKGMCGGVLISKIDGNFKIIGMHIAGNGVVGCSAMLYGLGKVENQGQIVCKVPSDIIVHQPTQSTLHPNLLHGVWPVEMGPSVTHPKDKRLEIEVDSIIKYNADLKYPGNVFNVNRTRWELAVTNVAVKFQKVLGINKCVDMITAVEGFDKFNHIDLNTSAGIKYSRKGLTKKDLIQYNPTVLHPRLVNDVNKMMDDLVAGVPIKTTFATYMKDELRKILKIKTGGTRLIEACSLDYVVLHRMVMGRIYEQIYSTPAQILGCAVGINPWTDYDMLVKSLFQFNYCFDFSKWDGSLPPQLLEAGTYVLAMCHAQPQLVVDLMHPIIHSEQICLDEINFVEGGMPSGAPCTTVLNSVCNLIVCEYVSLSLNTPHMAVTYGDDLVFSTPTPVSSEQVCQIWKQELGLTATAADKTTHVEPVIPLNIEFLKRKPMFFHNSSFLVGALDLNSMIQHIMWSKSSESFETQLISFENELVLHGKEIYESIWERAEPVLEKAGIHMTTFELAYRRMLPCIIE